MVDLDIGKCFYCLILIEIIVGPIIPGHYPLNSVYYLHKLWLRQLIISSFDYPLRFVSSYAVFASIILRWLGAYIEDDVIFSEFQPILHFPSNLLNVERSVTIFGYVKLAPFQLTKEGLCCIDKIYISSGTNLGNLCTLMPGTRLPPSIIVGTLTLVTRETVSCDRNGVLLGIPARQMPFLMSGNTSIVNDVSSPNVQSFQTLILDCLYFFISKYLLITLYFSLPVPVVPFIHAILVCVTYHYSNSVSKNRKHLTFSETQSHTRKFSRTFMADFVIFVAPYLSGTQLLVYFVRAMGARIGYDVILPSISCIADPYLTTIGDHVRLNIGAYIQVGHDSVFM